MPDERAVREARVEGPQGGPDEEQREQEGGRAEPGQIQPIPPSLRSAGRDGHYREVTLSAPSAWVRSSV